MTKSSERVATWMNLQQANRVVESALEQRIRSVSDLSLAEFEVLFRLKIVSNRPLQMSEIASQLINSPSGMTRIADRLERDGLIERETPPENRRVVLVRLTAKGTRVLAETNRAFQEALNQSFGAHLSERDVAELRRLMHSLLEGNGAWSDARCLLGAPPAAID
ncbi:MAG TPA: MarR family transcriptional regulator [Candidatus Dormibacteraeota bacterium]